MKQAIHKLLRTALYASIACLALAGCDDRETVKIPTAKGTGPVKPTKVANVDEATPMLAVDYLTVQGGNCIVITTPSGKHMLIDAGPQGTEQSIIARLQEIGVQKLDWIVVSCADSAHIGSLDKLAAGMPFGEVYSAGFATPMLDRVMKAAHKNGPSSVLRAGSSFKMDEGITLETLAPGDEDKMPAAAGEDWLQNHGLVFRIRYNKASLLFTGTLGREERQWMRSQATDMHANVVSGLRHGDKTVADVDFVHEITPQIGVYMCDIKNGNGYPHRDALDAMTTTMTKLYRTDVQHGINLKVDAEGKFYVLASRPATEHELALAGSEIKRELEDPKPVKLKNVLSDPDPLGAQNEEDNGR